MTARRSLRAAAVVRLRGDTTGVAIAGATLVRQLRECGIDVEEHLVDLDKIETARIETGGMRHVIFALNGDVLERVVRRTHHHRRARLIAYWWWETSHLPEAYVKASLLVDTLWAPTRFVQDILTTSTTRRVRAVPPPLPPRAEILTAERRDGPFTFLVEADANSSLWRKNPVGACEAFRAAFPSAQPAHAQMIVKIRNASRGALRELGLNWVFDRTDMTLITSDLTRSAQLDLIRECDAVLSLARSEGFGLVLAEALNLGRLVIATSWSGSRVLAGHRAFWEIGYDLRSQEDPTGVYRGESIWGEPRLSEAASLIGRAVRERTQADGWSAAAHGHMAALHDDALRWSYKG